MKLSVLLLLLSIFQVSASTYAQKVTFNKNKVSLSELFNAIRKQTGYDVIWSENKIAGVQPRNFYFLESSVAQVLNEALEGLPLAYEIKGKTILIKDKPGKIRPYKDEVENQIKKFVGSVFGYDGKPLSDASIQSKLTGKKTSTKGDGSFEILTEIGDELYISFIGYATYVLYVRDFKEVNIVLQRKSEEIDNVVVTGIVDRKMESFTGAVTKISREELMRSGTMNVFQSLKNLDPSLQIFENLATGSNPNVMPDMQIRGTSSFPDLKGQYTGNPNQPLFIVDGFEMNMEKVNDLNINRIESITILKDASAKALYGARAANGIVVIETVKIQPGELRISYTGSYGLDFADLSSYNLTNAREKLNLEKQLGAYDRKQPIFELNYDSLYYANLLEVQNGVNTDWLAQPVRDGFSHRQTLDFEVGDERLRAGLNLYMANTQGVMKGSERKNLGGTFSLTYRHNSLLFRNLLQYSGMKSSDSPYGSFSEYARLNPYWRAYNSDGSLRKMLGRGPVSGETVYNPMYNASLNTKSTADYTDFTNNTYVEWQVKNGLKVIGRFGFSNRLTDSEMFLPGSHTRFIGYTGDNLFLKGSYDKGNGKATSVSGDININYSKNWGKHFLFTNVGGNVREDNAENYMYSAIGFPNDRMDNIIFAKQYASNAKPTGSESIDREIGALGIVNYSYADRYFTDLSVRTTASSQFGSNNRWGSFWAAGAGWNVHHERFMQDLTWLRQLKVRGSVGYTGSQNFNSYQSMLLYNYFVDNSYQGMLGTYLEGLANPDLKWQQKLDYNVGLDANIANAFNVRVDLYKAITNNLLTDITTPPSLGFASYKANLGKIENKGVEAKASYRFLVDHSKRKSLTLHVDGVANRNRILAISNSLKTLTSELDEESKTSNEPKVRFEEGQSMDAIWGVRSMGIDPATGKEIFLKKNGDVSDIWDVNDKVILGVNQPKYTGNFGANFEHSGFSIGFIASYRLGGQIYNQTLVDKVENAQLNYNVDKRAYYDSWKKPGDNVLFKNIGGSNQATLATSRFVQDLSELRLSSMNMGYDFYRHDFLKRSKLDRLQVMFNANDVFRISTVRNERGTAYPFARYFAFTIIANY